jgi:hypothetical protein
MRGAIPFRRQAFDSRPLWRVDELRFGAAVSPRFSFAHLCNGEAK